MDKSKTESNIDDLTLNFRTLGKDDSENILALESQVNNIKYNIKYLVCNQPTHSFLEQLHVKMIKPY